MKNEKCGGGTPRLTQPPAPSPQPRRSGISLTEVLIAMGILTLGLLGVASVFPVGSYYMRKADVADQGSAIAQSVMNDIVARGMLNPSAWYVMTPHPLPQSNPTSSPNYRFMSIDGKYLMGRAPVSSTFTRPFAEALQEGLKLNSADPVVMAKQFGHAFVIDPMFAAAATNNVASNNNVAAYAFPATAYAAYPWKNSTYYGTLGWDPWRGDKSKQEKTWPIRRVTFEQTSGWPMDKTMADSVCRGSDDLAFDFPNRDDRPAAQNWDTANVNGTQTPLARQWTGDYSWIVTVSPTTNAARDGMARNPEGFAYDVSVVVFYKRPMPSTAPVTPPEMSDAASHERSVGAKIISTGPSGGEILLEQLPPVADPISASPFDQLKAGQWIMLCGPHPNSSIGEPRFALNWYQVLAIDGKEERLNYQGTTTPAPPATDPARRLITVRGPQWPWQPQASYYGSNSSSNVAKLSSDLCVAICRGAVAVHSKTLRLESPLGGAFGSGMTVFTPPGVTRVVDLP